LTTVPGAADLAEQLRAVGVVEGGALLVHASYRAIRPIEGGPGAVIEALHVAVGSRGTIVMPSWGSEDDVAFDPDSTPVASDLGVVAEQFRHVPGALRSDHPFAFAALGPAAAAIVADDLPVPPHRLESPVGRVYELDGQVLLLGVGHDADTTIHLAEVLALVPYRTPKHCTVRRGSGIHRVDYLENDHCCLRFALADDWLRARGLQREGMVGNATARLVRSRDIVAVVSERLRDDPLLFLHPPGECDECDTARGSVPSPARGG
jgi:aminoglycoside 3-N-acetyltransferase